MDASQIKALMGKLNKNLTKALEAAAGTCIQRSHFEITAEHCLLKLLDQSKSDISVILNKLGVNLEEARREIDNGLNQLNTGNHAKPKFSPVLLEGFAQAWNFGNLERGESRIRSAHLLIALLRDQTEQLLGGSRQASVLVHALVECEEAADLEIVVLQDALIHPPAERLERLQAITHVEHLRGPTSPSTS